MQINVLKKEVNKELRERRKNGIDVPQVAFIRANNDTFMEQYNKESKLANEVADLIMDMS